MISTADLQEWMKADDADAPTLRLLEEAAVKAVQEQTGRYFGVVATQTEIIRFKGWPLQLKNEPIGGVLTSLSQWDGSAWSALADTDYYVDGSLIWPNATYSVPAPWLVPTASQRFQAVYQAGYTVDPEDADVWPAPDDVRQAVLLLVGNWFENRESVIIGTITTELEHGVKMLLAPHTRVSV